MRGIGLETPQSELINSIAAGLDFGERIGYPCILRPSFTVGRTGASTVQFVISPKNVRMVSIEMNPRVSRSSALASKATGCPIAKITAKLAVGYRLDEIRNDITLKTPACFEPTIDYVVAKIPKC